MNRFTKVVVVALVTTFLLASNAEAGYLDPNTGGMLFQMLAASFTLISGLILVFAGRIKMFYLTLRRRYLDRKQKSK